MILTITKVQRSGPLSSDSGPYELVWITLSNGRTIQTRSTGAFSLPVPPPGLSLGMMNPPASGPNGLTFVAYTDPNVDWMHVPFNWYGDHKFPGGGYWRPPVANFGASSGNAFFTLATNLKPLIEVAAVTGALVATAGLITADAGTVAMSGAATPAEAATAIVTTSLSPLSATELASITAANEAAAAATAAGLAPLSATELATTAAANEAAAAIAQAAATAKTASTALQTVNMIKSLTGKPAQPATSAPSTAPAPAVTPNATKAGLFLAVVTGLLQFV